MSATKKGFLSKDIQCHILLLFVCLVFSSTIAQAQISSNKKAKLYFTEAEKRFGQNDFETALEYINKTQATLGTTNGRILNLKVKTLYNLGQFHEANRALNKFEKYSNQVTESLKNDTYSYLVRIERAIEELDKREDKMFSEAKREQSLYSMKKYVREFPQ